MCGRRNREGQNNEILMPAPRGRDANRQGYAITCTATRKPSQASLHSRATEVKTGSAVAGRQVRSGTCDKVGIRVVLLNE
jgi:hypothetical protein